MCVRGAPEAGASACGLNPQKETESSPHGERLPRPKQTLLAQEVQLKVGKDLCLVSQVFYKKLKTDGPLYRQDKPLQEA